MQQVRYQKKKSLMFRYIIFNFLCSVGLVVVSLVICVPVALNLLNLAAEGLVTSA